MQRGIIKRKDQFLELVPRGKFIPESVSSSNDPYFDDPRDIVEILKAIEQVRSGNTIKYTPELREKLFGDL